MRKKDLAQLLNETREIRDAARNTRTLPRLLIEARALWITLRDSSPLRPAKR